jgi:hypothetical protein
MPLTLVSTRADDASSNRRRKPNNAASKRDRGPTADEWERVRPVVEQLHRGGKKLKTIQDICERDHHFTAKSVGTPSE